MIIWGQESIHHSLNGLQLANLPNDESTPVPK